MAWFISAGLLTKIRIPITAGSWVTTPPTCSSRQVFSIPLRTEAWVAYGWRVVRRLPTPVGISMCQPAMAHSMRTWGRPRTMISAIACSRLALPARLTCSIYFTPDDQATLTQYDIDLGSGGVLLLPDHT